MCINDHRHAVYNAPPELTGNTLRCLLFRNNQRRPPRARAALIFDEAQEMLPAVLAELRLLSSDRLDSQPGVSRASNAQYARRNEPRDESGGDCRSHDRGSFVQRRIIICEYFHDCEIDRSAQTSDGDSIAPHFAKHRFATHSAERAIFLKRIDDAVRKYP